MSEGMAMRVFGWMPGLAMAFAAVPAQAQWSDVEGGRRHDGSGLVCPSAAGGFELMTQVATATGFSCRYALHCSVDQSCEGAAGFAAVTWNPAMDFDAQFRSLVAKQKLVVVDEAGPAWVGPPKLFARASEGFGAWWLIQPQGKPLNIAVFYNAAAEPGARGLVEATVRANP